MNKKRIAGLTAALLGSAIAVLALMQDAHSQPAPIKHTLQELDRPLIQAMNHTGLALYARVKISAKPGQNMALSPYSVSEALDMAWNGAAGLTDQAMRQTLQLGELDHNEVNRNNLVLRDLLTQGNGVEFHSANSLWLQAGIPFFPDFLQQVTTDYEAQLNKVELSSPGTMDKMNRWVAAATKGRIPRLLDQPLERSARLAILNAITFDGAWERPFRPSDTSTETFHLADGSTVPVPMMHQSGTYAYKETDQYQAVQLPYQGNRMNLTVIVPSPKTTSAEIKRILDGQDVELAGDFGHRRGSVALPRYEVHASMKLNDALTDMGMGSAFDSDQAEFSGMSNLKPLSIGPILHEVEIKVDEKGTKAAAVTALIMAGSAAPIDKPFSFRADRPFLFAIRDTETGAILFVGTVMNPAVP